MRARIAIAALAAPHILGGLPRVPGRAGETFRGIGMSEPVVLRGVEVVVEDAEKLVAVYPYRDADVTKVTTATRETTFMTCGVPGIEWRSLVEAAKTTREYVERFCH